MPVRVAGAGSGGRFRKVPESSGVCRCRFRRRVPEGSETLVSSGGKVQKVPESSGVVCCFASVTGAAM